MNTYAEIMALTSKPAPIVDSALDEQFWDACSQERLCFQCCSACGNLRHLPRYLCPRCRSPEWSWKPSSGRGTVFSWTVVHMAMHPAFAADVPYVVAVIELEEGVRMVSRLHDVDPAVLRLGDPVEVCFVSQLDGPKLPFFRARLD